MVIPIFLPPKPDLNAILEYLEEASSRDQYSNYGALYKQFRNRVASHVGLNPESVVLVSNATVALEAAISTYMPANATIQESQNVWTLPSWSFAATGLAAKRANIKFQFGDVTLDKGILDVPPLQSSTYSIGVAPFGSSIEDSVFADFSLIDAAASFDSLRSAAPHMSDFTGVVLSFHATKTLSSGDGGAFISKDTAWAERVRAYISFGFPQGSRSSEGFGTNGKMSEITAAFGLASLDQWPKIRHEWNVSTQTALEISKRHDIQVVGALDQGFISPYWIIKLDSASEAERLELLLAQAGVETRRWWERGMHRMHAFSEVPIAGPLVRTEIWAETTIGLPLHTRLTGSDFSTIDKVLQSFARRR